LHGLVIVFLNALAAGVVVRQVDDCRQDTGVSSFFVKAKGLILVSLNQGPAAIGVHDAQTVDGNGIAERSQSFIHGLGPLTLP
jgi:hypothetical protein